MLCCAVLYYALWLCMVLCCTLFCGVLSCSMHVVVMSALKDGTRSRLFDLLDQNGDGVLTREEWLAAVTSSALIQYRAGCLQSNPAVCNFQHHHRHSLATIPLPAPPLLHAAHQRVTIRVVAAVSMQSVLVHAWAQQ